MSPTRLGYRELGIQLTKPLKDSPCRSWRPHMAEETRDDRTGDPINFLLEEALTRQRNEMMDNFSQIPCRLPTTSNASTSNSHSRRASPFKVQVNFYIHVFEGQIDADALEKWLILLEGYFSVHNFYNREKISFALLKVVPHVKDWWETHCEQASTEEPSMFSTIPTWASFVDALKEQYYPVGSYDDQYTRWTTLWQERDQAVSKFTNVFHTLHTKLGIKDSERHLALKYYGCLHIHPNRNGVFGHLVVGSCLSICCQNRAEI